MTAQSLALLSVKVVTMGKVIPLKVLASCVKTRLDSCTFLTKFEGRRLTTVVDDNENGELASLAQTAPSVSSATRAAGQIEHLGGTKPNRVMLTAARKVNRNGNDRSKGPVATTPGRKRKSQSRNSPPKQPRLDEVLAKLARCSVKDEGDLSNAGNGEPPNSATPSNVKVLGKALSRCDISNSSSAVCSDSPVGSKVLPLSNCFNQDSSDSRASTSTDDSTQSDHSSSSSDQETKPTRSFLACIGQKPTLKSGVLNRHSSSKFKQRTSSLKKSQIQKLPDPKQRLLSDFLASKMDGAEKSA